MLILPLLLCGCAGMPSLTDMLAPPYVPEPIKVFEQATYAADLAICQAAGTSYKPKFHIGTVVAKAVDGATSNTSLIPVSPLVPAYGAAGGAIGAAGDGLDVMSGEHAHVYQNCLRDFTRLDHSAIMTDPRP